MNKFLFILLLFLPRLVHAQQAMYENYAVVATNGGGHGGSNFISTYITNGLVEWNKLNDGSGTLAADASGNGNTLPLVGAPSWGSNYVAFNGTTQYGDAGSNQLASLDAQDLTICAWINKTGYSVKGIVDKGFYLGNGNYGGWGLWLTSDNHLDWVITGSPQHLTDGGLGVVIPGEWTFVALVWHYGPSGQADFYINGVLNSKISGLPTAEYPSGIAPLEVGNIENNASGGIYAFDGSMRDVAIYNRALSAAEVQSNYFSSHPSTAADFPDLLYYKMTEFLNFTPPVTLADSSTLGTTTGTVNAPAKVLWTTNVADFPATAVAFDGGYTSIDTSNAALFNFTTNAFTLNLWVCPFTQGGFIAENGILNYSGWYLNLDNNYRIKFGTESNGTDASVLVQNQIAPPNVYTMVTVVRTGPTTASIYMNGRQAASGTIIVPASTTNSLVFGKDRAGYGGLNGDIWLPQVWSKALSSSEVADLFIEQSTGYPWPGTNSSPGGFSSSYIASGLVQWNKLNDGSGTNATDFSGNGNTLPLVGMPAWGSNYLTFNGTGQYGDAGSNQLTSLDQHDLTISAWINKTGISKKGIVDKGYVNPGVGSGGWGFWTTSDNHLDWSIPGSQELADIGIETIPLGQWTFVTVVWHYGSSSADFYIDGVMNSSVGSGAITENPSLTAPLEVGNLQNNSGGGIYAFDGAMHDVAIYNRALSAAEVGANFFRSEYSTNVTAPDLLYYKMTEFVHSNPPVVLADYSTAGDKTGTVFATYAVEWVTNVASVPSAALHFNGVGENIETSNSVIFNFTTNLFTINLWARPLTANGYLMQNGFNGTNGWYLSVGGAYQIKFGTETNDGVGDHAMITTGSVAGVGQWNMVTIVRNGLNNAMIYINGVQVPTTGSITSPASSANSLQIGVNREIDPMTQTPSHALDGDIWLPQIWGQALTPADIANLYLRQKIGQPWP